jgi:hypothetical protein
MNHSGAVKRMARDSRTLRVEVVDGTCVTILPALEKGIDVRKMSLDSTELLYGSSAFLNGRALKEKQMQRQKDGEAEQ